MIEDANKLARLTAQIVSAQVSRTPVTGGELPSLIKTVYNALATVEVDTQQEQAEPTPSVPVKKSVSDDYITCLECGAEFQILKRHIGTEHDLSPQQYRAKWKLSADYPMTAPNYANIRSEVAKQIGLGHSRRKLKLRRVA